MSDAPQRPANACVLHRPPREEDQSWILADAGYATCGSCYDRLRSDLKDVVKRYGQLDATPGANTDHSGGRGASGFESRSPASDHIITMTDPRSSQVAKVWVGGDKRVHFEQERPPASVHGELDTAAWAIAEARGIEDGPGRHTVAGLADWIDGHLDWVTRRAELVCELTTTVRQLLAQLRPVTGDARKAIGRCREPRDAQRCGATLRAPYRGDTIKCGGCGKVWPRSEWEWLGKLLQDGTAA